MALAGLCYSPRFRRIRKKIALEVRVKPLFSLILLGVNLFLA